MNENIRAFISYAHENLDFVSKIDEGLRLRKLDVWFDKRCLKPGPWKKQIEKQIPKCRYFIICISEAALRKTGDEPGFQDEELQQAYEIARNQTEHFFTIIPVRIEECARGDNRISIHQQYDLFNNFESELDQLAVNIGGCSLANKLEEDMRSEDEKIVDGLHGKAEMLYYADNYKDAFDIYKSILILKPSDIKASLNKGNQLFYMENYDEAIVMFEKALELSSKSTDKPSEALCLRNLCHTYNEIGSLEKAAKYQIKAEIVERDIYEGYA